MFRRLKNKKQGKVSLEDKERLESQKKLDMLFEEQARKEKLEEKEQIENQKRLDRLAFEQARKERLMDDWDKSYARSQANKKYKGKLVTVYSWDRAKEVRIY